MLHPIPFPQSKIMFQFILIFLYGTMIITCQLNLYDTKRSIKQSNFQFDCLNYHVYHENVLSQVLKDITDELIPYCFRPANHEEILLLEGSAHPHARNISFEDLYLANVTSEELISWSITIDIVEQFQIYLNNRTASLNKYFYNCTKPWFGPKCQYSFASDREMSFNEIVEVAFNSKMTYDESYDLTTGQPCYILLECHRNGERWCLDWREVCDGFIDCFDDGIDEQYCYEMEMNECANNEFRCRNGLCISSVFWEEGKGDADCLDPSDELHKVSYKSFCFRNPTFRCEEHTCSLPYERFKCGDGQCGHALDICHNGRHQLLDNALAAKGNLTKGSWIAMVCWSKIGKEVNGILCEDWLNSNANSKSLKDCPDIFQFPTIPVYSDFAEFFFKNNFSIENALELHSSDYICYDEKLCDFQNSIVREYFTLTASFLFLSVSLIYFFLLCVGARAMFN